MARTPLLSDQDLSVLYKLADKLSGRGQKRTKNLVRLELTSLVVAALFGVTSFRVGPAELDLLAAVSAVAFIVALGLTVVRSIQKPEAAWYVGRAAAESVRTLAWRFALGGDPFPLTLSPPQAVTRFLARLEEILDELQQSELPTAPVAADDITTKMAALRLADLATRKDAYEHDRINDQLSWYNNRAGGHAKKARAWFSVTVGASILGIVAAGIKFVGVWDVDMLGVFGAVASAAIAWNQLNQHRNQVSAYTLTTHELRLIRTQIAFVDDTQWPTFVSDSEDAISREHTLWLARRGHPGLARR